MSLPLHDILVQDQVDLSMTEEARRMASPESTSYPLLLCKWEHPPDKFSVRVLVVMFMSFPLGRALRSIPVCEPVLRHLFNIW